MGTAAAKPHNAVSDAEADATAMLASTDYAGARTSTRCAMIGKGINISRPDGPLHRDQSRNPKPAQTTSLPQYEVRRPWRLRQTPAAGLHRPPMERLTIS